LTSHRYRAMRDAALSLDDTVPGTFEGHPRGNRPQPQGPQARIRRRLEARLPEGILRRPDLMVLPEADMDVDGAIDPRTPIADWTISTDGLPRYDQ